MRESSLESNLERHTRVSISRIPIRSSISAVASTANPIDSDKDLATNFQCFSFTNDPISDELTSKPPTTLFRSSNNMNDSLLAQTFSGENFEPIMVTMYIKSIEERADCLGRDTAGKCY